MANFRFVLSEMRYLKPGSPPPELFFRETLQGETPVQPDWECREVRIQDIRSKEQEYSLDKDGFAIIDFDVDAPAQKDRGAVEGAYYSAVSARVKAELGASHALAFSHNYRLAREYSDASKQLASTVRNDNYTEDNFGRWPAAFVVHNDYSERGARQRLRELLSEREAKRRLKNRFAIVILWRPINHPAEDVPLAVCRADSLSQGDFQTCTEHWPDREGEIYLYRYNPAQEWCYLSRMEPNRALLMMCFDSASDGRSRGVAHTAFRDPSSRPNAKPRESVEVRVIAFFN